MAIKDVTPITPAAIGAVLGGRKVLKRQISSLEQLQEAIRDGVPAKALQLLVSSFALPRDEASAAVHIAPTTFYRYLKKRALLPADASDRLVRLARVAAYAEQVLGGRDKASRWLSKPNRSLRNRSPLSLLDTEIGGRQVEQVLGRIDYGVYG